MAGAENREREGAESPWLEFCQMVGPCKRRPAPLKLNFRAIEGARKCWPCHGPKRIPMSSMCVLLVTQGKMRQLTSAQAACLK
jgi:hypothetical protein